MSSLDQAIAWVTKAIEQDEQQNFAEALRLYQIALQCLTDEKNKNTVELITSKTQGYMERAETLKKHLASVETPPTEKAVAAKDDHDADTKKLRQNLSSSILTEVPNVSWDDIAGLESAKEALKEAVILPIKAPHLFTGARTPWKGILLYGPPGTGKSYLAKAVATEAKSTFFSISSSDLVSKWMGESERLVKQLFAMARESKPSIIFIDEIDSLTGTRGEGESEAARRIKTEFLVQMGGVGQADDGVLVMAATNLPWGLDAAIKRRFEKRIYIPLPDQTARQRIFELHVAQTKTSLDKTQWTKLAALTEGYSGSDIAVVVRDAIMQPVRRVLASTHWKETSDGKWTPCSPGDKAAVEKSWQEIDAGQMEEGAVTWQDMIGAVSTNKPAGAGQWKDRDLSDI